MVEKLEQYPLYNEDWAGGGSFVRLLVVADDKKGVTTPVFFTVEYRETAGGEWKVPDGWATEFLSNVGAHFAWNVCPGGAYMQIARWLEMELYINGKLRPDLQSALAVMTEQDFKDTFEKCFVGPVGGSFRRPYLLGDLEARIVKKRVSM